MNRAYSLLTVKAVDDGARVIRGIATTPSPDRVGDVVEPLGVDFKNPLPLLWQHKADKPVGFVTFDKPTKAGITFEATLAKIEEPGALRDRVEEAWQSVKAGLVRAVSIGFRSLEHAFMQEGGIRFLKSEVLELSLVTIPANPDAIIAGVKSLDPSMTALIKAFDTDAPDDAERPSETQTEVTQDKAATGQKSRVVKLSAPARDRAKPFVIRSIKRTTK